MLGKDKLVLDTTSLADSDNVGAYLRDAVGNLITSQVNGAARALDVGINVAGVQVDPRAIRALTATDVVTSRLQDGAGNAITSTAGALDVNVASGSFSVSTGVADKTAFTYGTTTFQNVGGVFQDTSPSLTAGQSGVGRLTANRGLHVNLRDALGNELLGQQSMAASVPVVFASDQSTLNVSSSGNIADDAADSGNPLKVGSRSSWGNPSAVSANNDRADLISDKYRRLYANTGANIAAKTQAATVGVAAALLIASSLSGKEK